MRNHVKRHVTNILCFFQAFYYGPFHKVYNFVMAGSSRYHVSHYFPYSRPFYFDYEAKDKLVGASCYFVSGNGSRGCWRYVWARYPVMLFIVTTPTSVTQFLGLSPLRGDDETCYCEVLVPPIPILKGSVLVILYRLSCIYPSLTRVYGSTDSRRVRSQLVIVLRISHTH